MPRQTEVIDLPSVSAGTRRFVTVHRYGRPGARPKAYLQAALHADEWPGLLVLHHMLGLLDQADREGRIAGEIVVVPYANPVGLAQQIGGAHAGRYALDGSGNFNRAWPDLAGTAAELLQGRLSGEVEADVEAVRSALREAAGHVVRGTEVEALRATLLGLAVDADIVLDLHCDNEACLHLYGSFEHQELLKQLADDLAVPVVLIETDPGGGPFDHACAAPWRRLRDLMDDATHLPAACFATTVELRGQRDVSDAMAGEDAAGIVRFLTRQGILTGDVGAPPGRQGEPTPLEAVDVVRAPVGGIIMFRVGLGERVSEGQVVAEIVDPAAPDPAKARVSVACQTAGVLFAHKLNRLVQPGDRICKVAGQAPLSHRKAGNLLEP